MFWGAPLSRMETTAPVGMKSRPSWWQHCPGTRSRKARTTSPSGGAPSPGSPVSELSQPRLCCKPETERVISAGQGKRRDGRSHIKPTCPGPGCGPGTGHPANSNHLNTTETQIKWDPANSSNQAAASWCSKVGKSGLRERKRKEKKSSKA